MDKTIREEELDTITHIWERFNPGWIITGAVSGAMAGLIVLAIASIAAVSQGYEWSQPSKYLGATFFGGHALTYGGLGVAGLVGILFHTALSMLYGATFAQLVSETSRPVSLVVLGLVTSFIIWIFGWRLFLPSINHFLITDISIMKTVYLHLSFGLIFGIVLSVFRGTRYQ